MSNKNNIILIIVILVLILVGAVLVFGNNYKRNAVEKSIPAPSVVSLQTKS
jgi:flagellar basal body-associated protein FliL